MLIKITYQQIEFIKIMMNCKLEKVFINYAFIQKPIYSFYVRESLCKVMATYEIEKSKTDYFSDYTVLEPYCYSENVNTYSDYYPFWDADA